MKNDLFHNPSRKGYILIPRNLFGEILNNRNHKSVCREEAFLTMLYMIYHTDCQKANYLLKRGESDLRLDEWADLFGWSIAKTRGFFNYLLQEKQISYKQYGKVRILSIVNYELFCSNQTSSKSALHEKPMNKSERMFNEFWESYHELTSVEPDEQEAAKRIWRKLKLQEKQMAINNMYDYMMRTEWKKNLKKAYRYLLDREFR